MCERGSAAGGRDGVATAERVGVGAGAAILDLGRGRGGVLYDIKQTTNQKRFKKSA